MDGDSKPDLPEGGSTREASQAIESDWDIVDRLVALPITSRETHMVLSALAGALAAMFEEIEA